MKVTNIYQLVLIAFAVLLTVTSCTSTAAKENENLGKYETVLSKAKNSQELTLTEQLILDIGVSRLQDEKLKAELVENFGLARFDKLRTARDAYQKAMKLDKEVDSTYLNGIEVYFTYDSSLVFSGESMIEKVISADIQTHWLPQSLLDSMNIEEERIFSEEREEGQCPDWRWANYRDSLEEADFYGNTSSEYAWNRKGTKYFTIQVLEWDDDEYGDLLYFNCFGGRNKLIELPPTEEFMSAQRALAYYILSPDGNGKVYKRPPMRADTPEERLINSIFNGADDPEAWRFK